VDSLLAKDSLGGSVVADSLFSDSIKFEQARNEKNNVNRYKKVLDENRFVTNSKIPVVAYQSERLIENRNSFFYAIALLFFFLGIIKVAFEKYFKNMIRVFFNTSLRQSQLKDQLLQDRLPSLFFNLLLLGIEK
jgi:hypothetical protein